MIAFVLQTLIAFISSNNRMYLKFVCRINVLKSSLAPSVSGWIRGIGVTFASSCILFCKEETYYGHEE